MFSHPSVSITLFLSLLPHTLPPLSSHLLHSTLPSLLPFSFPFSPSLLSHFYVVLLLSFAIVQKSDGSQKITGDELIALFQSFVDEYPIESIEDPFDQDDWEHYHKFSAAIGEKVQVVGDDLLVTNPKRVGKAISEKSCNALLLKVNQIGSVTESIEAVKMSKRAGWGVMTSHRSGETEDTFIADLAVGLSTGQIKTGAPCRSERLAKYNQLLRIEEELGDKAVYAGEKFRKPVEPY